MLCSKGVCPRSTPCITNNLGAPNLLGPGGATDQLNAFGAKGSNELLIKAYAKFGWEQTAFVRNLRVSFNLVLSN